MTAKGRQTIDNQKDRRRTGPAAYLGSLLSGMVPLFVFAHFSHHVVSALLQPLQTFIRDDFGLTKTQLGFLQGTAYNLPYGLSQLPAGWLADRVSPRVLITVGIAGVAAAGLLVGLSPAYAVMVAAIILLGLLGGGYHPAAAPLVTASTDKQNPGAALGLHQIGGTASFFLTPLIAAGLASLIGWRGAFVAVSLPALAVGIALFLILGRRRATVEQRAEESVDAPALSRAGEMRRLAPMLILGVTVQVLIFSSVSFVPVFANETLSVGKAAAGGLLALAHLAGLFAGPIGGYLSDHIGRVWVMLAAGVVAGPAIYLLNQTAPGWSLSVVLLLMGTCQYLAMPTSEAYIISHAPERRRSTILGVYYMVSRGGPGIVMPVIGGLIDSQGYTTAFTTVAIAMVAIALVCGGLLLRNRD